MNIQQFLLTLNDCATLVADDCTFLGLVSSNQHDLNSICNPRGEYGSPHGFHSVRNPHGFYGGRHGFYSPYNPHSLTPPAIVYQGRIVLRVTKNSHYISANMVSLIDPDFLFGVLLAVGSYARTASSTTQLQGEAFSVHSSVIQFQQIEHPHTWYVRGNEMLNSQCYEDALAAFDRAIQLAPDFLNALFNRGLALLNLQ